MAGALLFVDEEGEEVELDAAEAAALLVVTSGLDGATVSACPSCRSRVVAAVALVDLLNAGGPHPRAEELVELAEEAPTLHLYVVDESAGCRHERWRDPLFAEWLEVIDSDGPRVRP